MYDASTTRWSEQMVLGSDSGANTDGPVPIEIDRVHQKGKGKSGKGKSKDKGFAKGQSKEKQKGKDSKGKSKGNDSKGSREALVIDQRGKAKVKRGSAIIVVVQGIWPVIAGSLR